MFTEKISSELTTNSLVSRPELVEIDHVTKSFGQKVALKDISFSVPSGQLCGLLGPNSAGKTTLFRLLMGILKATAGTLLIDGLDAFEKRVEVKRRVGFLPDEPVFYSYLSGREILELSAAMHGLDVATTMDRIAPLIARLRLADDIDTYGQRSIFCNLPPTAVVVAGWTFRSDERVDIQENRPPRPYSGSAYGL